MKFGFPTGKLSDITLAEAVQRNESVSAVAMEYSCLRFKELTEIFEQIKSQPIVPKRAYSLHAPANYHPCEEVEIVKAIRESIPFKWNVILHPDSIYDWSLWRQFGSYLLIENMDLRKRFGMDVKDMTTSFRKLPAASMCFDIGHARQVDPTMDLAKELYSTFKTRIREIHMSTVLPHGEHAPLTEDAVNDFRKVLKKDDLKKIPIILETKLTADSMTNDWKLAQELFA